MQFKKACSASCVWHSDRPVPAFSGWMSALFYFSSHALSNIATNPDLGDVKKAFYKSRLELLGYSVFIREEAQINVSLGNFLPSFKSFVMLWFVKHLTDKEPVFPIRT